MSFGVGIPPSRAENGSRPLSAIRGLRREEDDAERCELCGTSLRRNGHRHLFESATRQVSCACIACTLLFPTEARKRYRAIPQRTLYLTGFALTDAEWEALAIPVGMAFLHTTESGAGQGVAAFYPGPAGATESLLPLAGWEDLVERNPVLRSLEPDVEALLVDRVSGRHDHYLVPIDRCYELVGLIRVHWRGLSGGQIVWERIQAFFTDLRRTATERGADAP